MQIKNYAEIKTLGQLKKSGYKTRHIKDEMRDNLVLQLAEHNNTFDGIIGYNQTVTSQYNSAWITRAG